MHLRARDRERRGLAPEGANTNRALTAAATLGPASRPGIGQVVVLGAGALSFGALAAGMGLRVVRGPDPHLSG